jgi:hypothetical protein
MRNFPRPSMRWWPRGAVLPGAARWQYGGDPAVFDHHAGAGHRRGAGHGQHGGVFDHQACSAGGGCAQAKRQQGGRDPS